ncbi:hypothetical protein ACVBEQ_08250 [Nakamurella sp. GG22]
MKLPTAPAIIVATFAATLFAGAFAGPALAQGGSGDVRASGQCSAASTWKLKAKPDDGRLQIEMEVDSNRVGQKWAVSLTDNTVRIFAGNRVTTAPSGSFSVELRAANRAGSDRIVGTARNTVTGERCTGVVRI